MIWHVFQDGASFALTDEGGRTLAQDMAQDELLEYLEQLVSSGADDGLISRLSNHAIVDLMGVLPGEIAFFYPTPNRMAADAHAWAAALVPF